MFGIWDKASIASFGTIALEIKPLLFKR